VKYHSLPSLEDAGKSHFKKIVFENVKKEATNAIISLINSEREGDIVNKTLIR
jgi:cullin 1